MRKPKLMKKFMGKLKQNHQNLSRNYVCENCKVQIIAPMHCDHAMHIEVKDDGPHWVCWMGSKCGDELISQCCDLMNLKVEK